jgi:hypothetical protein
MRRVQRGRAKRRSFGKSFIFIHSVGDNNDAGEVGDAPYGVPNEGRRSLTDCLHYCCRNIHGDLLNNYLTKIVYNVGIMRSFLERSGRKFGKIPARDFPHNSCYIPRPKRSVGRVQRGRAERSGAKKSLIFLNTRAWRSFSN